MLASKTHPTQSEETKAKDEDAESICKHEIFKDIPRKHRRQRPVNRSFYENSRLCRVNQLDLSNPLITNIQRGGVIFYTFINGILNICLGRDKDSDDLTDFGGTRRKRENPIQCAVRESNEESRRVFSVITPEQVENFFCLYSSKMLIIFVPVISSDNSDIRQLTRENFENKEFLKFNELNVKCYNEISEILWFNEAQINNLFSK